MAFLLATPALLLLLFIYGWPLLRYGWLSFHADSVLTGLQPVPNGGANWTRLVFDDRFWQDVLQTSRFALVSVGLELVLALGIALLLDQRWRGRGRRQSPDLAALGTADHRDGTGMALIFNTPYGPLNQIATALGGEPLNLLASPQWTWLATVLA